MELTIQAPALRPEPPLYIDSEWVVSTWRRSFMEKPEFNKSPVRQSFASRAQSRDALRVVSKENSGFAFRFLKAFLPVSSSGTDTIAWDALAVSLESEISLEAAFNKIPKPMQREFETHAGPFLQEILSLSQDPDRESFWQGALQLARRVKQANHLEASVELLRLFAQETIPAGIQQQAKAELDAILGTGAFALRAEFLLENFARQASDYQTILPMLGASVVSQTLGSAFLGRLIKPGASLLKSSFAPRLIAGSGAFLAETAVFTAANHLLQPSSAMSLSDDWKHATLSLGALKLFGFAGNQAALKVSAAMPANSAAKKISDLVFPQSSLFLGLWGAHHLETLFDSRKTNSETRFTDLALSLVSLQVGAHLARRLLGPGFATFQNEMRLSTELALSHAGSGKFPFEKLFAVLSTPNSLAQTKEKLPLNKQEHRLQPMQMSKSGESAIINAKLIKADSDPILKELERSLADLETHHPEDSNRSGHWKVIADRLQELCDTRGTWLGTELEKARLISAGQKDLKVLQESINAEKYKIDRDIEKRFGRGVRIGFDPEKGIALRFDGTDFDTIKAVLESEYGFLVRSLTLVALPLTNTQLYSLAHLPCVDHLTCLNIYAKFKAKTAAVIANSPFFKRINHLAIYGSTLADEGAKSLACSPYLKSLIGLTLVSTGIGDSGVQELARSTNLRNIKFLNLENNPFSDLGVQAIAGSPHLTHLSFLNLKGNHAGITALLRLMESTSLINLSSLHFQSQRPSKEFEALLDSSPHRLPKLVQLNGRNIIHPSSTPRPENEEVSPAKSETKSSRAVPLTMIGPALLNSAAAEHVSIFEQALQIGAGAAAVGGLLLGARFLWRKIRSQGSTGSREEFQAPTRDERRAMLRLFQSPWSFPLQMALGINIGGLFGGAKKPQPLPENKTQDPIPQSYAERRNQMFDEIVRSVKMGGDALTYVSNVLSHSLEDGLLLADRLKISPEQWRSVAVSSALVVFHPIVFREIKKSLKDRARFQNPKVLEVLEAMKLSENDKQNMRNAEKDYPEVPGDFIHEFYLDAFLSRKPPKLADNTKLKAEVDFDSKGTQIAHRYLEDMQKKLDNRFYAEPLRKMFEAFDSAEPFHPGESTVWFWQIVEYCARNGFDFEAPALQLMLDKAEPFEPILKIEKADAKRTLIQEINENAPTGMRVEWDGENRRYRLGGHTNPCDTELTQRLADFEKRILEEITRLLGVSEEPYLFATTLAGLDSPAAWEMREYFLKDGVDKGAFATGLAGLDSTMAWTMRERLVKAGVDNMDIALSLSGVDSERAWAMRERILETGVHNDFIAASLGGLDSPKAWAMRRRLEKEGVQIENIAISLAGLDSPEAWTLRERLLKQGVGPAWFAKGLVGLDSAKAWALRERVLEKSRNKPAVAIGLAGLDSAKAWELRAKLFMDERCRHALAMGLAGLDSERAWMTRNSLLALGVDGIDIAEGLAGTHETFMWRLRPEWGAKQLDASTEARLDLLNRVHRPTLDKIHEYFEQEKSASPLPQLRTMAAVKGMPHVGKILTDFSKMNRDTARALLRTNPAIPDRAHAELAKQLTARMFPTATERAHFQESFLSNLSRFFDKTKSPVVAFREKSELQVKGSGYDEIKDKRVLLESSQAMESFLVTGIYGRLNPKTRCWEKVNLVLHREPTDPSQESTFTLPDLNVSNRISLPLPHDGRLILERVRGIDTKKKAIPLVSVLNSLGEAIVEIPSGVVKLSYAVEAPLCTDPMREISEREYSRFLASLTEDARTSLTAPLGQLPLEIRNELRTPRFLALSPKQKIHSIEALVRKLGWYDAHNEAVAEQKLGKTPEEQLLIAEQRMEALRRKDASIPAHKRFAGVCADFATLTIALLREAGIPAGLLDGIYLEGKKAQARDLHGTAFVPWPDERGGIRIIPVDGTPADSNSRQPVSRPELAVLESRASEKKTTAIMPPTADIDKLRAAARAESAVSIRKLTNGELENALNFILQHEVKRSHLRVVQRILNASLFGGFKGRTLPLDRQELAEFLASEIILERQALVPEDSESPAGSELMNTLRRFLEIIQKVGAAKSSKEAWEYLKLIATFADPALNDVERRAFAAILQYLRPLR